MGRQAYLMAFNLIGFWGFGVVRIMPWFTFLLQGPSANQKTLI